MASPATQTGCVRHIGRGSGEELALRPGMGSGRAPERDVRSGDGPAGAAKVGRRSRGLLAAEHLSGPRADPPGLLSRSTISSSFTHGAPLPVGKQVPSIATDWPTISIEVGILQGPLVPLSGVASGSRLHPSRRTVPSSALAARSLIEATLAADSPTERMTGSGVAATAAGDGPPAVQREEAAVDGGGCAAGELLVADGAGQGSERPARGAGSLGCTGHAGRSSGRGQRRRRTARRWPRPSGPQCHCRTRRRAGCPHRAGPDARPVGRIACLRT
jgi:hypothetical protein